MKAQGEWINHKYRVLNAFPFVIGVLYFAETKTKQGDSQTRFIHGLEIKPVSKQIQREKILIREDAVFFPIREVFIENDCLYQVFQSLEGTLLAHHLQQKTPVSLDEMTSVMRGVTYQLLRLYKNKQFTIVHPQNIMITSDKGIRFIYGGPLGALPKGPSLDLGDPNKARKLDNLYDSYTIGVMIYQMLTGKNPMSTGLLIPPISTFCKDCPKELDQLISRALSFNIHSRPQVEEIADVLDKL
ncbi:hypothetical protein EDD58_104119 [Hazenella coriacea]|uniref:Protein kinase domain-containing protein n=2 Tax=Hazenella coriacea TaxID=1179467 RepID=A0A4R3L5Z8_9BACL|nr:hypothetical protein EDD58_104119 [Hazenella coriacea]